MYVGQRGINGEVFVRCTECGDSVNPRNAHLACYQDGGTHCFRCGHSGRLSMAAMFAIATGDTTHEEVLNGDWEDKTASVSERFTVLETFEENGYYCWQMRKPNGDIVGWHNREIGSKKFNNEGQRGLGFVGDKIASSIRSPLIIVEGPYDVLTERHVCVFGKHSKSTLMPLRLQHIVLYPDPDVIDTREKRRKFGLMIEELVNDYMVFVHAVVFSNADPDEATVEIECPVNEFGLVNWEKVNG